MERERERAEKEAMKKIRTITTKEYKENCDF